MRLHPTYRIFLWIHRKLIVPRRLRRQTMTYIDCRLLRLSAYLGRRRSRSGRPWGLATQSKVERELAAVEASFKDIAPQSLARLIREKADAQDR